ncbi:hypothetical protein EWF20_08025 [Sulfolobus sp. S-194]|uniref:hypothetical protein n=1 Tax=Sulfolobus sp. S-194 TaxID=2512240 RepID=UPI001436FE17|nr:hypothetical protein [Sulfolobus sp. S-194]QIW24097.1 hypothetical protein EWF20_08025 [Sulfolobus sp. S-194]
MRGLGTVIGIVIFLLILLTSLALIIAYLGEFQIIGAQISQSQINIYNHNNAKLTINSQIEYLYSNVIYSGQCTSGSYYFIVTITEYSDPIITVKVNNPSQITQTINDLIISAGNPMSGTLIGTTQNGQPPNYASIALPELSQLLIAHIGSTVAPSYTYTLTLTYAQLYPTSPYILNLYIPQQYYEVEIKAFIILSTNINNVELSYLGTYYYAFYHYSQYTFYYPYYGAPPYLTSTNYIPTDWQLLPNNPIYPFGNLYFIVFTNFGNVGYTFYPLGG